MTTQTQVETPAQIQLPALDQSLEQPIQQAAQEAAPQQESESKPVGVVAYYAALRPAKGEGKPAVDAIQSLAKKLGQSTTYVDPASGETRESTSVLLGAGFCNDKGTITLILDARNNDTGEDFTDELKNTVLTAFQTRLVLYPQHRGGVTAAAHLRKYRGADMNRAGAVLCTGMDGKRIRVGRVYYNNDGSASIELTENFSYTEKTGNAYRMVLVPEITPQARAERQRARDQAAAIAAQDPVVASSKRSVEVTVID